MSKENEFNGEDLFLTFIRKLKTIKNQRPSTRPSESFYNNFVHFELKEVLHSENVERLLKKKRHVRELTHKLVSKANNLDNNIFIVVNSL